MGSPKSNSTELFPAPHHISQSVATNTIRAPSVTPLQGDPVPSHHPGLGQEERRNQNPKAGRSPANPAASTRAQGSTGATQPLKVAAGPSLPLFLCKPPPKKYKAAEPCPGHPRPGHRGRIWYRQLPARLTPAQPSPGGMQGQHPGLHLHLISTENHRGTTRQCLPPP